MRCRHGLRLADAARVLRGCSDLTAAVGRLCYSTILAGPGLYVIMKACRGGRPAGGRGATRCGSPCRAGAAGVPGGVRADFERALADPADPAIASAEIASELRRGADYVRVAIALAVVTTDVADALTIAWDAFHTAARDDLAGWEVAAAAAQVQPEPSLTGARKQSAVLSVAFLRASRESARDEAGFQLHLGGQGHHVAAFLPGDGDRVLG